jgi:ribose transport system permease protein
MKINLGLDRFSGLYLWALFIIAFSVLAPSTFMTATTVHILASTQAVAAIAALALLIPMVTGQFDLSIGTTANLSGLIAISLLVSGFANPMTALIIATLTGTVIGFINGFIVVKLRVNSFIATLGMSSIIAAFQIIITNNEEPLPTRNEFFGSLTQTEFFGFQAVILYLIIFALAIWWVLERTPAGRYMHATGGNPEAARLTGIRVDMWAWLSLIASGTISAFAGVLFVSLTGPSLGFGATLLLPAFAAVFLGSTQLSPGKMNVWGTLIAIFTLATGVQGLQLITGVQWVAPMFDGVALVAAVALAVGRERRASKGGGKRGRGGVDPDASANEVRERLDGVGVDEPSPNQFGPPGKEVD